MKNQLKLRGMKMIKMCVGSECTQARGSVEKGAESGGGGSREGQSACKKRTGRVEMRKRWNSSV